jgi:hypothetical protein
MLLDGAGGYGFASHNAREIPSLLVVECFARVWTRGPTHRRKPTNLLPLWSRVIDNKSVIGDNGICNLAGTFFQDVSETRERSPTLSLPAQKCNRKKVTRENSLHKYDDVSGLLCILGICISA